MEKQKTANLTNEQFIAAHARYNKDGEDIWSISFTCADGYCFSIKDYSLSGRNTRKILLSRLTDTLINQHEHPIQ